jgi:PTS system nitrogen regulatory IIA component
MAARLLKDILQPNLIKIGMAASDKDSAIRELLDVLDAAGMLPDRATAEQVVFDREKIMSTGLESGIAIPHGKTDTVASLVVAVGTAPAGIEFACADGQPARILLLTLSPATTSGPHIRFMAEVSRVLRDAAVRDRILAARSAMEIVAELTR